MEPESSLPHSQVPAICPYPEPALGLERLEILIEIIMKVILLVR